MVHWLPGQLFQRKYGVWKSLDYYLCFNSHFPRGPFTSWFSLTTFLEENFRVTGTSSLHNGCPSCDQTNSIKAVKETQKTEPILWKSPSSLTVSSPLDSWWKGCHLSERVWKTGCLVKIISLDRGRLLFCTLVCYDVRCNACVVSTYL